MMYVLMLQPPPREDTAKIDAMTKQLEGMKEQLKSKDRELGAMEDELDNKNTEITATGNYRLYTIGCMQLVVHCWLYAASY